MVLADTTFLDVFWYSILFFFWIMAIWIFIALISDVIRRDDLSGGGKALWIVFMIILPFLGCLVYIIVRPKVTAQEVRMVLSIQAHVTQAHVQIIEAEDELARFRLPEIEARRDVRAAPGHVEAQLVPDVARSEIEERTIDADLSGGLQRVDHDPAFHRVTSLNVVVLSEV